MENTILNEIVFEPGQLLYKDVRYVLIRPEVLAGLQKQIEAELGLEKCAQILIAAGNVGGAKSSQRYKEVFGYSDRQIVEFMCNMGSQIGWGSFRLASLDIANGELIVEVKDSPFAAAYGAATHSVCHLIRGVMGGMGAGIFGGEVTSAESACVAKGDARCRFEIKRKV